MGLIHLEEILGMSRGELWTRGMIFGAGVGVLLGVAGVDLRKVVSNVMFEKDEDTETNNKLSPISSHHKLLCHPTIFEFPDQAGPFQMPTVPVSFGNTIKGICNFFGKQIDKVTNIPKEAMDTTQQLGDNAEGGLNFILENNQSGAIHDATLRFKITFTTSGSQPTDSRVLPTTQWFERIEYIDRLTGTEIARYHGDMMHLILNTLPQEAIDQIADMVNMDPKTGKISGRQ
eukprot:g41299.t1